MKDLRGCDADGVGIGSSAQLSIAWETSGTPSRSAMDRVARSPFHRGQLLALVGEIVGLVHDRLPQKRLSPLPLIVLNSF